MVLSLSLSLSLSLCVCVLLCVFVFSGIICLLFCLVATTICVTVYGLTAQYVTVTGFVLLPDSAPRLV